MHRGQLLVCWDNQGPDLQHGQWPLYANTAYAIEGNIKQQVPEWNGHNVQIKLEQSAYFDGKTGHLSGRTSDSMASGALKSGSIDYPLMSNGISAC